MASDDIRLIDRHLSELRQEVVELRKVVEETAKLEHEATLAEVHEALVPALRALVRLEATGSTEEGASLAEELRRALPALGLTPTFEVDEVLELWPDEALEDFMLDREVPREATMVRVKVKARGWTRGMKVVVQPTGEVIEVIHEQK